MSETDPPADADADATAGAGAGASDAIFERNLERLLARAYVAVLPGEAYRAGLEATVEADMLARQAAHRGEASPAQPVSRSARPQSSGHRTGRRFSAARGALLAAAALVLAVSALWWLGSAPDPGALARLLAQGHVVWRDGEAQAWTALAGDAPRARLGRDESARDFATPARIGLPVDLAPDGALALLPSSQASLARDAAGLRIDLLRGGLDLRRDSDAAASGDDWLIAAGDRRMHLETGALSVAWDSQTAGVSVLLWSGRAWLETPDGRRPLLPGQSLADALAERGLPEWEAPLPPAQPLVPEPARDESADAAVESSPGADTPSTERPRLPNSLQGRVVDRTTSRPVPAYTLTLVLEDVTSQGPSEEAREVVSSDGRFAWGDIEAGSYALFAQAPGYATGCRRGLQLGGSEPPPDVELRLEPGGRLVTGRVVDASSGAPVPGALVLSESDAPVHMLALDAAEIPEGITARTTTNESGGFTLSGLASGTQVLRATAPGFAPQWVTVDVAGSGERAAADGGPPVELRLPPPAAVQGRVTLDNGAPAPGMFVLASLGERSPQRICLGIRYGITDEQGRYRLDDLPAEEAVVLMLGPVEQLGAPTVPPRVLPVQLQAGQTVTLDFLGKPRVGRLHGRIVDAAGEPARALMLSLVAADSSAAQAEEQWSGAMTDEQGGYEFGDLAPGRYAVYLVQGAGVSVVRAGSLEFFGGGDQRHDLQLPGAMLTGILRDGVRGEALPDGLLLVTSGSAASPDGEFEARVQLGADGRFSCGPFPPGRYRLQAHAATADWGEALLEVELPDGRAEVAVVLECLPGGSLSVLALDEQGTPLRGARVELTHPAGRRIDFARSPFTDGDGGFRVGGISTGWWSVRVSLDGRPASVQRVEIRAGETSSVRAVLAPGP